MAVTRAATDLDFRLCAAHDLALSALPGPPVTRVAKDKGIPPFLILHVADRPDSSAQSQKFGKALRAAGMPAQVVAAAGKTQGTINSELGNSELGNSELGLPGDKPTQALFEFLAAS